LKVRSFISKVIPNLTTVSTVFSPRGFIGWLIAPSKVVGHLQTNLFFTTGLNLVWGHFGDPFYLGLPSFNAHLYKGLSTHRRQKTLVLERGLGANLPRGAPFLLPGYLDWAPRKGVATINGFCPAIWGHTARFGGTTWLKLGGPNRQICVLLLGPLYNRGSFFPHNTGLACLKHRGGFLDPLFRGT